jgi:hypothetical protein
MFVRAVNRRRAYDWSIVTLREFEDRDQPRRFVVGTPDDAPPEWTPGPTTARERAANVAGGGPAVVGLLAKLVGLIRAAGSALH